MRGYQTHFYAWAYRRVLRSPALVQSVYQIASLILVNREASHAEQSQIIASTQRRSTNSDCPSLSGDIVGDHFPLGRHPVKFINLLHFLSSYHNAQIPLFVHSLRCFCTKPRKKVISFTHSVSPIPTSICDKSCPPEASPRDIASSHHHGGTNDFPAIEIKYAKIQQALNSLRRIVGYVNCNGSCWSHPYPYVIPLRRGSTSPKTRFGPLSGNGC